MAFEIYKKLKRHWPAILIAAILGFLMILPFLYFQVALGPEYQGVLPQFTNDELFYMARIKDVLDGHMTLGNAYLLEHKNQLPQQLFLPEWLLAQPLRFFNINLVQGRILYNFILPAVAFILTYIVFYLIYPSRFWANVFAVFLFFGLYLFKFTRPVIPQFVFLFWLTQFIFLWLFIKKSDNKKFMFLNILNFGLLFYIYPFYWTFYLVFFVILTFIFFFKEKFLSKSFLKVLVGGLLIGSFYFYISFLAGRLPEYHETLTRLQLVFSRSPSEIKSVSLAFAVLVLIGILYRLKVIKINREILLFIAGIVSILLVTNQNIITGQKFEFGHYRMPAIFFLTFALYYLWSKINFKFKIFTLSFLMIMSIYGVYNYAQKISKVSGFAVYTQKYKTVFDWLSENTLPDSVVYANEEISSLIPVYTENNVFYSRFANLFIISDKEVLERFILNNFFENFDREFVIKNERAIWGVRYIDRYGDAVQANKWRKIFGLKLKSEERLSGEEVDRVITRAQEIQKDNFEKRLKKYRIDYFIWDEDKSFNWHLNNSIFLRKVFENENFVVYKVK